ncbi:MAG: hypothetical protein R3Y46_04555 [Opitutales bacterium]
MKRNYKMETELHLIVLWGNARDKEQEILDGLNLNYDFAETSRGYDMRYAIDVTKLESELNCYSLKASKYV